MARVPHIVPGTLTVSLLKVSISEPFSFDSSCLFSLLMEERARRGCCLERDFRGLREEPSSFPMGPTHFSLFWKQH